MDIRVWHGSSKTAVIIPEISYNSGWTDFATKIIRFLGKNQQDKDTINTFSIDKSYHAVASIESWPEISQPVSTGGGNDNHPFHRSLVGTFNDPFHRSPNPEIIQKWFVSRWKVTTGFNVIPLEHNQFLFDFPSRQEAIRVKAGEWSKGINSQIGESSENIWQKVFGIPLIAWSMDTFKGHRGLLWRFQWS
ncbi:unnamed protein product [Withania somnifera]